MVVIVAFSFAVASGIWMGLQTWRGELPRWIVAAIVGAVVCRSSYEMFIEFAGWLSK